MKVISKNAIRLNCPNCGATLELGKNDVEWKWEGDYYKYKCLNCSTYEHVPRELIPKEWE